MNKARFIAISGVCGAIAVVCLILAGLPALKWVALILAVMASIAVAVPILIDPKGLLYSLLTFVVSGAVGVFMGMANIVYVAPIIVFCMPFSIVKVYGETVKISAQLDEPTVLEDPFGGEDKTVVQVSVDKKQRLPVFVRWIIYYVLLEAALALTLGAAYLFTRPVFDALTENKLFIWIILVAQLVVPPYNLLMRGCLIAATKVVRKIRP